MSKLIQKINHLERRLQKDFQIFNSIEISKSAILYNFDFLKNLHDGFEVIPVLKSNAYGHGITQVAQILRGRRFPYIAVDAYFEALRIRAVSNQPILIMGVVHPSNFPRIKLDNFAFAVGDKTQIEALGKLKKPIKIHLDINTGMNRQGFQLSELGWVIKMLRKYKKIELEGVMTHLADADNSRSNVFSNSQIRIFNQAIEQLLENGFSIRYVHHSNSPASAKLQSKYANTIRPGISLYGINPLTKLDSKYSKLQNLKPALTLKSTVTKIIKLERGDRVSYNGIFTARQTTRIATLPLGYYEGIPRSLSNKVWIKHRRAWLPSVGRICMNHLMVNIGIQKVKMWDEVVVISAIRRDKNSVEQICADNKLFSYSLLSGLNQNIRRVIVD